MYVDGESHYCRTEDRAKKTLGCTSLTQIRRVTGISAHGLAVREDCSFVWDSEYLAGYLPARSYYFTSYCGTEEKLHEARTFLRGFVPNFDPEVIKEDKDKRKNRKAGLEECALIEKPKGCDINLAVRMIEDAALNNYQGAYLFTSDADYLPLIRSVRRMGKQVILCGYKENLGNPELAYAADEFRDLGGLFARKCYELISS